MIIGAHFLLHSNAADADRAFFRDVLGFPHIDAGGGWFIFALPPAEAAIHPMEGSASTNDAGHPLSGGALYLMCDDLQAVISSLRAKNVECSAIEQARWGMKTMIPMPGGGHIGLYQPAHATALNLQSKPSRRKSKRPRGPKPSPKKKHSTKKR